ncbi:MAG: nucleoside hydrolase, partial [Acidobacteriota bacterium]
MGETARRRVWVDTDVALGAGRGDVDDGFALAALFGAARAGQVELLGVSTVTGNTDAGEAARCAARIAEACGVSVPLVEGAGASRARSRAGAAIAGLPPGCAVIALGPLSNLAAAALADPSWPARTSLAVVGGNLSSRGVWPPVWPHEFNFARDRAAARRVLGAPWESLTVYPLDVVRRLRCDAGRLGR